MNPLASDLKHILDHTRGLWEELRGQRIFITGGTGFFGCWLLESFASANDTLGLKASAVVLTRSPRSFAAKMPHLAARSDLSFLEGDVRDFSFPVGSFPFVIHAGTTTSAPTAPLEMFATIVDGTRRVMKFAATHGTHKLLFVSSGAVYGQQPSELTHVSEDHAGAPDPLNPASAYGEGKRAAELVCRLAGQNNGFEIKIARCFAFVGPHLPFNGHFAIGNFIRDALAGEPIRVNGDGTPFRSYLHAADLTLWLWTILFKGPSARAFNVGSRHDLTVGQLAELVKTTLGSPHPIQITCLPQPGAVLSRYVPSVERAANELDLRESWPLSESIRRTAAWCTQPPLTLPNESR